MDASGKFHTLVTSATVLFMYAVLIYVVPFLNTSSLTGSAGQHTIWIQLGALLLATIGSVGIYHTLATILEWIFLRIRAIRKLVLGPSFLEGTWIGSYIEDVAGTSTKRWTVEHFEQTLDSLVIRGKSYDTNGIVVASWESQAVQIDAKGGKLIYAYDCAKQPSNRFSGLGIFSFERHRRSDPPHTLDGFAADLTNGKMDANRETKLTDEMCDMTAAFREAKTRIP
jgi:hypothetical protein